MKEGIQRGWLGAWKAHGVGTGGGDERRSEKRWNFEVAKVRETDGLITQGVRGGVVRLGGSLDGAEG